MTRITPYEQGDGDAAADAALEEVRQTVGMIPNFHRVLARNPAVLKGFTALHAALGEGVLSPLDREIVALVTARRADCAYCGAAHAAMAARLGMDAESLEKIKAGTPLPAGRAEAVRQLAEAMHDHHGALPGSDRSAAGAAGLDAEAQIEVAAVIGTFTLATMVNRLAATEVDF